MDKRMEKPGGLPAARALRALGADIALARKRRRMRQVDLAAKMGVSVKTLKRIEQGDSGVAVGHVAMALFGLGAVSKLESLMAPEFDHLGLLIDANHLPKRIRLSHKEKEASNPDSAKPMPL